MIHINDLFDVTDEAIVIRDTASPDDLARWTLACIDDPGAAGIGYADTPHYNVVAIYRSANYWRKRDLQNIVADAIQRLATDPGCFLGDDGAHELLLLVDPIILQSHRIDDVVNSVVSIATTTIRSSTRLRTAALQALLSLPVRFGPAFWLEQYERLGPDAVAPVMEGLAREAPQRLIEFVSRIAWSNDVQDAFISIVGAVVEASGVMATARTILPALPMLPEQVAEAISVLFAQDGVDIFSLMLETPETCEAVLGSIITGAHALPPSVTLSQVVRNALHREPTPAHARSLNAGVVALLSRLTSEATDLRVMQALLDVATVSPDLNIVSALVTMADYVAITRPDNADAMSALVLSALDRTSIQLRALTTHAVGTYNHDVNAMLNRALARMVANDRLAEPVITFAAAHLPLDTLERVVHAHLISERTSVAAVATLIARFHPPPTVTKLLASIWGEAMIEHELDLATRIARDYPAIHRSTMQTGLSGERVLEVQDAAAPDGGGLIDGLLNR